MCSRVYGLCSWIEDYDEDEDEEDVIMILVSIQSVPA